MGRLHPASGRLQARFEGIVSKRRNSPYRSGGAPDWIKSKNPDAPGAATGAAQ